MKERQVHIYPVEEPDRTAYLQAALAGLACTVWLASSPLVMVLIFWLALLARSYRLAWTRSRTRIVTHSQGLSWKVGEVEIEVTWDEVRELSQRLDPWFRERLARVETSRGRLEFVLKDSPLPGWSAGRAIHRAEQLWKTLESRSKV